MLNWLKTLPARTLALLRAGLEKMKRGSLSLLRAGLEKMKRGSLSLFRPGLERIKRDGPPLFHAGLERVKRVDLSPARSWLGRGKRDGLQVGVVLTVVYILLILVLWGSEAWALAPNELGDFLAGVFTPLALGWLVYGYFLQTRELGLQRQELALTRDKLSEQVELLRKQREDEDERSLPRLKLEGDSVSGGKQAWKIRNNGAIARELKVFLDGTEETLPLPNPTLGADEEVRVFSIPYGPPAQSFRCEARFISSHQERLQQIWEITRTGGTDPTFESVKELTKGPTPLEEV